MTCTGPPLAGPPLVGFWAPSAYEATGSDLHRVYLARLRCVSRLSQPPDALIPPGSPHGSVSRRRRSWGSTLQRFSLLICRGSLSTPLPLLTFSVDGRSRYHLSFPSFPCLCPVRGSVPRNGPHGTGSQASRKVFRYLIMPSEFFPHAPVRWTISMKDASRGSSRGGSEEPHQEEISGSDAPVIPPRRSPLLLS
jgi:hypothetical protein